MDHNAASSCGSLQFSSNDLSIVTTKSVKKLQKLYCYRFQNLLFSFSVFKIFKKAMQIALRRRNEKNVTSSS